MATLIAKLIQSHAYLVLYFYPLLQHFIIFRYNNGILIKPIETMAMQTALGIGQTPFALLRPHNGIPVLVRVLLADNEQVTFIISF